MSTDKVTLNQSSSPEREKTEKSPIRPQRKKRDERRKSQLELEAMSGVSDCESVRSEHGSVRSPIYQSPSQAESRSFGGHADRLANLDVPLPTEHTEADCNDISHGDQDLLHDANYVTSLPELNAASDISFLTSSGQSEEITEMGVDAGVEMGNDHTSLGIPGMHQYGGATQVQVDPYNTEQIFQQSPPNPDHTFLRNPSHQGDDNTIQDDVTHTTPDVTKVTHNGVRNTRSKFEMRHTVHGNFPGDFLSRYLVDDPGEKQPSEPSPRDRKHKFDVRSHLRRQTSRGSVSARSEEDEDGTDRSTSTDRGQVEMGEEVSSQIRSVNESRMLIDNAKGIVSRRPTRSQSPVFSVTRSVPPEVESLNSGSMSSSRSPVEVSNASSGWSADIHFSQPTITPRRDYNRDTDTGDVRVTDDVMVTDDVRITDITSATLNSNMLKVTGKRGVKSLSNHFPWTSNNKVKPGKGRDLEILIIDPPTGKEDNKHTNYSNESQGNKQSSSEPSMPQSRHFNISFDASDIHNSGSQSEDLEVPREGEPDPEPVYMNLPISDSQRRQGKKDKRWTSASPHNISNSKIPPQPKKPAPILGLSRSLDDTCSQLGGIDEETRNLYTYAECEGKPVRKQQHTNRQSEFNPIHGRVHST